MLNNLKRMLSVKAPLIVEAFQNPVDESKFSELEEVIKEKIPTDFRELYLNHNGFNEGKLANLFYGFPFSRLEDIISAQKGLGSENDMKPLRFSDEGIKSQYTFGKKRVPIGDDSGTSLLCIDLDPGKKGAFGQIIMLDYEMGVALLLNESIQKMISQFEIDLSEDKYSLQEDALEDGVHWLEPIREIDPGNWFNSPRWQYVSQALKTS